MSSPSPTTAAARRSGAGRAWRPGAGPSMALTSMVCVQLGVAASAGLFDQLGAEGTTALRLGWAAVVLLVLVRPRRSHFTRSAFRWCVVLGLLTGGMTLLFMAAVARLPLGTAAALEFLGPLGVAVARGRGTARLWAAVAAVGVVLLTEPWRGGVDLVGCAFAIGAALCWAGYILLTQRVGQEVSGLRALAVTMPVAAVLAVVVAEATPGPSLLTDLTWPLLLVGAGLALLLPVVPFSLELLALRRMTTAAFGTLMALEPAIALVVGLVALHQLPGTTSVVGIALVVAAGVGAERSGAHPPRP